jgi:hypothetical protein
MQTIGDDAMGNSRLEADQCNEIRRCQIAVEQSYKDVGAGKKGAMDRYNKANSNLAAAHYRHYQINAGLATDVD